MKSSEFVLTQGMGQKLEFAVQRNGGNAADIEWLSTGDNFQKVTALREGKARLTVSADWLANCVISRVKVNRARTAQQALDATGRKQSADREVVNCMPRGVGDEVEVLLFEPEAWEYTSPDKISYDDFKKCFERRNLKPAFPDDLAAMNEVNTALTDKKSSITCWVDGDENFCCITFDRGGGERTVRVFRHDERVLYRGWCFAGSREVGS